MCQIMSGCQILFQAHQHTKSNMNILQLKNTYLGVKNALKDSCIKHKECPKSLTQAVEHNQLKCRKVCKPPSLQFTTQFL